MKKRLPLPSVTRSLMPVLVRAASAAVADGFTLSVDLEKAVPVRVLPIEVTQDALVDSGTTKRREIERKFGRVGPHGWRRLYLLSGLLDGVRYNDPRAMDRFFAAFKMAYAEDQKEDPTLDGDPRDAEREVRDYIRQGREAAINTLLCWVTGITCHHVRFCTWVDGLVPRVGLLALTLEQAIGVHLLLGLQLSSLGVGVCKKCGHNFKRTASDDKYCSLKCGNAARQAEYRKRHGKTEETEFYPVAYGVVRDTSKFRFRRESK